MATKKRSSVRNGANGATTGAKKATRKRKATTKKATKKAPAEAPPVESPPADDGFRDAKGRFVKGNPGGPGNPRWARQARFNEEIEDAISEGMLAAILRRVAREALHKHTKTQQAIQAAELIFNRAVGRPRVQETVAAGYQLGPMQTMDDVKRELQALGEAAAAGQIDTERFEMTKAVIIQMRETLVAVDLEGQLAQIEAWRAEQEAIGG